MSLRRSYLIRNGAKLINPETSKTYLLSCWAK